MSKLFPMFKKKGKGKEDDINEDDAKRKVKVKSEKVKDNVLSPGGSSSSPSKYSKSKKKGKGSKEKRSPNGKLSKHTTGETEAHHTVEDFFVDDDGAIRIGSQKDNFIEGESESMAFDNERSLNPFDQEDEDQSFITRDEAEEIDQESILSEPKSESDLEDHRVSLDTAEFNTEAYATELSNVNKDVSMTSTEYIQNSEEIENYHTKDQAGEHDNSNQEIKMSFETYEETTFDHEIKGNIKLDAEEIFEVVNMRADKANKDLEMCNASVNEKENWLEEMSSTEIVCDIKVVKPNEEKSLVESPCEADPQVPCNGNLESDHTQVGIKDLHDDDEKLEILTSERDLTSSQDSDDDFDSAQEDWDEDDDDDHNQKIVCKDGFGKDTVDSQICGSSQPKCLPVHDATNSVLVDGENGKTSEIIKRNQRSSSEYEDSFSVILQNSSLLEETSDNKHPATIVDRSKTRKISGSEKLVRKLSGISIASSDAFNEEVDDLLDEELDRLSEEEETGTMNNKSSKFHIAGESLDSGAIGGIPEKMTHQDPIVEPSRQNDKPSEKEKPGSNAVLIEDSGGHHDLHPVINSNVSQTSTDKGSIKASLSESQEMDTSVNRLSPSDETLDQVKDSGYYSLPVSPNPGAVVRANGEGERGGKEADDSFGDSEEEGMITPPSEVSTLEDKTENPKQLVALIEDDANTSVVSESDVLYQTCCESQGTGEFESTSVKGIKNETNSDQVSSEKKADMLNPKQSANLKVIIPSSNVQGREEMDGSIISPKCGSPVKMRQKSPLKETEESFTTDPVGDRFLQQAVLSSHEEAEARLAQRRAARAEARELRLRELEKQQQDQENEEEKQFASPSFAEPSPRTAAATRTSVGRTAALNSSGQFSRRSSEDSTTDESALPANVREMRAELKELDEKFRKAMITNAQLDNEKSTLTYEVELIKDKYTELEETHTQLNKEHRKKCTEYEQLKKVSTKLQEEVKILRGLLQERDQLIQEYGLIVIGEEEENGEVPPEPDEFDDMDNLEPRKLAVKKVLLSQEAAELLEKGAAKGSLDVRLKKFGEEKNDLEDQVRRLKLELEEERIKNRRRENGLDYEKQKEQSKNLNEYKFRVQKAEAEVLTLQANVARLDALSTRYKTQSEELEKSEEELKVERRKLQRELRDAQSRLEELETTNNHLIRRFDKLKNARSTLLKDLSQEPA